MMFERFTDSARGIVTQAQLHARRLGHGYIGCEHLLMGAATVEGPAGAALREQDITPERIQLTLLGTVAPLSGLDEEALASIGIDLDAVRAKVEAEFGPDALTWAGPAASESRRPAWGKGPSHGHIPFTPRAKKTLELSLREAEALHDNSIGAEHITLALLIPKDGTVPRILAALGAEPAAVRAAILARYRKAS